MCNVPTAHARLIYIIFESGLMSSVKMKMMEIVQLFSSCVWDQTQPRREAPKGCFESRVFIFPWEVSLHI